MRCPFCGNSETQVVDSRVSEEGDAIRRRRRCQSCDKRFTTYERVELAMPSVVKRNGSRSDYDPAKLRASLSLALRKRPVSTEDVDAAVARIEEQLLASGLREVASGHIGELVMNELRKLDKGGLRALCVGVQELRGHRRIRRGDPRDAGAGAARQAAQGMRAPRGA